jgi:hypothetical protein
MQRWRVKTIPVDGSRGVFKVTMVEDGQHVTTTGKEYDSGYIRRPSQSAKASGTARRPSGRPMSCDPCVCSTHLGGTNFLDATIRLKTCPQINEEEFFIHKGFLLLPLQLSTFKIYKKIYKKQHPSTQLPGCYTRVVMSLTPRSNYCGWPVLWVRQGYLPHPHPHPYFTNMRSLTRVTQCYHGPPPRKFKEAECTDHIHRNNIISTFQQLQRRPQC